MGTFLNNRTVKAFSLFGVALLLGQSDVARAAIAFTGFGQPPGAEGEIVFEIWNGVDKSYTVDTGIIIKDLVTNPASFNGRSFDLGDLSDFQTAASQWVVWGSRNDGGYSLGQVGFDGTQPGNFTGVAVTSSPLNKIIPGSVDNPAANYTSYNDIIQAFAGHAENVNTATVNGEQNWAANEKQRFIAGDKGYFGSVRSNWNNTILADTAAPPSVSSLPMYFLTTTSDGNDGIFKVIGAGGSDQYLVGTWKLNGSTLTFSAPGQAKCALPGSTQTVNEGQNGRAWKVEKSANCNDAQLFQERSCGADGNFSPAFDADYKFQCGSFRSCALGDGTTLAHGESKTAYSVQADSNCAAKSAARTCNDGTLDGDPQYQYGSCQTLTAGQCALAWGAVITNGSPAVTAYKTSTSNNCDAVKTSLQCSTDGRLLDSSGATVRAQDYPQQSCSNNCSAPWDSNQVIPHGGSVAVYESNLAADCGKVRQGTLSCNNGQLTGSSFIYPSCAPASACNLPWGGQLIHGGSITAFQAKGSRACAAQLETRVCNNGQLSGSFQQPACEFPITLTYPNGGEVLRARQKDFIKWRSAGLRVSQRLNLYFSKNGGRGWRLIKSRVRTDGVLIWTPKTGQVTDNGLIRVCSIRAKGNPPICDVSDRIFSIGR